MWGIALEAHPPMGPSVWLEMFPGHHRRYLIQYEELEVVENNGVEAW